MFKGTETEKKLDHSTLFFQQLIPAFGEKLAGSEEARYTRKPLEEVCVSRGLSFPALSGGVSEFVVKLLFKGSLQRY